MKNFKIYFLLGISLLIVESARGTQDLMMSNTDQFAGGIIITNPTSTPNTTANSASENRNKAISARDGVTAPTPLTITQPTEDTGVLSPSSMSAPPDNRNKARNYSLELNSNNPAPHNPSSSLIVQPYSPSANTEPSRINLEKNLSRARGYADGTIGSHAKTGTYVKLGTSVGVVGTDGIIVFNCSDINNSAGRIGDDTKSGNSFTVQMNGKAVMARCQ